MTHRPRAAILHHGFVPTYRRVFYEALERRGSVEYVVYHGAPPAGTGLAAAEGPFSFPNVKVENREIDVGRFHLIYQPLIRAVLSGGYDAVIMAHEVKFVANMALFAACRWLGIPVLFWGQGYHVRSGRSEVVDAGVVGRLVGGLKDALSRRADGYIAYTEGGARRLRARGVAEDRIWAVRNTIDIEPIRHLERRYRDLDPTTLRREFGLGPQSVVLLFLGRLIAGKRVETLIEAVSRLNTGAGERPAVELLLGGHGPMLPQIQAAAAGNPAVHLLGAVYDPEIIARAMRVAAALVLPGPAGLAVNQALAHGVPVITRADAPHGPEIEYLDDDVNGLVVAGDLDDFAAALGRFAAKPDLQRRLAEGALRSRESLSLSYMVERFDTAVATTIEQGTRASDRRRDALVAR